MAGRDVAGEGKFTLTNSAVQYPAAGYALDDHHYAVMLDGQEVGAIYPADDEWVWSINISMMGIGNGRSPTRAEARASFRKAWDERASRLGPDHVARALYVARGQR